MARMMANKAACSVPSASVAAGFEQGECTFQMIPRLRVLAGEPASHPSGATRDASLGRIGS